MKNTLTILAALFAVCIFVGAIGCDNTKKEKENSSSTCGPECDHSHGDKKAESEADKKDGEQAEPVLDLPEGDAAPKADPLPTELPGNLEDNELPAVEGDADSGLTLEGDLPSADGSAGEAAKPVNELDFEEIDIFSTGTASAGPGDTNATAYAPLEVTAAQLVAYVTSLEKYVADEAEFTENLPRIVRDANTVIALALVLGLHDQPNEYKSAAPTIIKAAQTAAEAKTFAAAKKDIASVKAALKSTAGGQLNWEDNVASMKQLMVQVPLLDGRIKTGLRRFAKKDEMAGQAVTIAVLCQASIPYVKDTEAPTEEDKWIEACIAGRNAAASLYSAISAGDKAASQAAYDAMSKTCDKCHETFHKAGLPK